MRNQTSAFINITSPEMFGTVITTLHKLEYVRDHYTYFPTKFYIQNHNDFRTYFTDPSRLPNDVETIDCGTNTAKFFTLAASIGESEYHRMFYTTDGKERINSDSKLTCQEIAKANKLEFERYATIEEIINHFKKEE